MKKLIEYLKATARGPINDTSYLEPLIIDCWDRFFGSDRAGMTAEKLIQRMENIYWDPPILSFSIERHGGLVLGSTRAEVQKWELNMDDMSASFSIIGRRQIVPMQERVFVKPIAKEISELIINHKNDKRLNWKKDGSVRIFIDKILPRESAFKQTLSGRRKRFRNELERLLTAEKWEKISYYHYRPPKD
jgi:hypothetical protein